MQQLWATSCLLLVVSSFSLSSGIAAELPEMVDFNFHIRPILSDRCFACHGPDNENREADFRIDNPSQIFDAVEGGEGTHYIVAKHPEKSEVFLRLTSNDEDLVMPPPHSNLSVTPEEISLIKKWIEQGAEWKEHWSFIPLTPVDLPQVKQTSWPKTRIDAFVLKRLEQAGLKPNPETSREQWLRRVSFDLTGLPPTLEEIDQFLSDQSETANETVVDRLLASPRYGERMAVDWLDIARYADTYGYQSDVYRAMWPWRDWVIKSFNQNLPFDKFITWQIAGDLLPEPSREQILATAFNRHHRQTNEGGSIEEEFRTEYVADRTHTFGTAFLGLTLECSRCHDHKFDPITQKEYYQFFSFFNSIDESGLYSHFTKSVPTPTLLLPNKAQQQKSEHLQQEITKRESELADLFKTPHPEFELWLNKQPSTDTLQTNLKRGLIGHFSFEEIQFREEDHQIDNQVPEGAHGSLKDHPQIVAGKQGQGLQLSGENLFSTSVGGNFTRNQPFSISLWMKADQKHERAVIFHRSRAWTDAGSRGYQLLLKEGKLSAALIHFWPGNAIGIEATDELPLNKWVQVTLTYDGSSRAAGLKIYTDGAQSKTKVIRDNLFKNITGGGSKSFDIGQRFRDRGFKNGLVDELRLYNRELPALEVTQLFKPISITPTASNRELSFQYWLANHNPKYQAQLDELKSLRKQRSETIDGQAEVMVMRELPKPRPTFVLHRGAYDAPQEIVSRNTPASLPKFNPQAPQNRLGLANWLTEPTHPLTSRVIVNRFWQSLFGQGLVSTADDFGSQGALPSHPLLLDDLANRFISSGWNTKALLKEMVLSATYRQTSQTTAEAYQQDPTNEFLARGPRFRLSAEMIRDQALFTSGLLVEEQGGPPVKPYQPAGLWKEKSSKVYTRDTGVGSHRRSLYTFWKRTSPPPSMITLDAAKRDVCAVNRQTTSTPLQALVLLNDVQYIAAAKELASRAIHHDSSNLDAQLVYLFRTLTSRHPAANELDLLRKTYQEQKSEFTQHPDRTKKLLALGDNPADPRIDPIEQAAMTIVVQLLLNYDEVVTKR